jgi:hypothetical protein
MRATGDVVCDGVHMTVDVPNKRSRVRNGMAIAATLVLVVVLGYGAYGYYRVQKMNADVLPEFLEPGEGMRAPSSSALGVRVGTTPLADVEGLIAIWGLTCRDTSMRALMGEQRDKKKAEIENAKARGDDVDGISGASLIDYRSPKERNPQVRLSCENTANSKLKDRPREESAGRVLFIFDSPKHPARHVSYRRQHQNHPLARDDLAETVNYYVDLFGKPQVTSKLPPIEDDGSVRFPTVTPYKFEWQFADLRVRVEGMSFGKRGVDVNEVVEVPWPVRANAPADAR